MTPIDTVYEFAGYKLAGVFQGLLSGVGLPLLVGLAGSAFVFLKMAEDGAPRVLGFHLVYLIFMAWLLSPATLQGVETPRVAAYLGRAADLLQRRAVEKVNERFLTDPFEFERVAAMAGFARVLDPDLAGEAAEFLEGCAKPALARADPAGPNWFRPGALPYGAPCESRRAELWRRLARHVDGHAYHRAAREAGRRLDPARAREFEERYLETVCVRLQDDPGSPTSEMSLVVASLGRYSYFDRAQSTGGIPGWVKLAGGGLSPSAGALISALGDDVANVAISGAAALEQGWANRFSGKQSYYLVTVYGPHAFGLAQMLVIGLFPAAGIFALVPGKWRVLVNYGKVFVSVKLWPVCWAVLSSFNARRAALEAFDPETRGGTDVFLAVASFYVLTPSITFMVIHLAVTAAAVPFSAALPPPSGPGLGPVGPALQMAARFR